MTTAISAPKMERITITPSRAKDLMKRNIKNRPLSDATVERYARDMLAKRWKLTGDPVRIDSDNNLIDGQHRLMAAIRSGCEFESYVMYNADPEVFAVVDQGRGRSAKDVLAIRGEKNYNILASAARLLTIYIRTAPEMDYRYSPNIWEIEATIETHAGLRTSVESVRKKRLMLTKAPASFMHYLFSLVDDEEADEFFRLLATGAELAENSPILLLRQRLIQSQSRVSELTREAVMGLTVKAWNAFHDGKSMGQLRFLPGAEAWPPIAGLNYKALKGTNGSRP